MARVKTLEDFSGKPAYMGVDVGKTSHWAYAVDAAGRTLLSRAVANDEADIRAALSGLPEGALVVVDQRKNIGALVLRTARSCGFPVAYLPGKAEHDLASASRSSVLETPRSSRWRPGASPPRCGRSPRRTRPWRAPAPWRP